MYFMTSFDIVCEVKSSILVAPVRHLGQIVDGSECSIGLIISSQSVIYR